MGADRGTTKGRSKNMIRQPQEFIERAIHVAEGIWSTLDRIARALEGKSSSPVP